MAAQKNQYQTGTARRPRFCVVAERSLAVFNERSEDEIVRAQAQFSDDMVSALESMVKAARAGQLEGRAALALEAVAW